LWFLSINAYTICRKTTKFDVVTHAEGLAVSGVSHLVMLPLQCSGACGLHNFRGSILQSVRHCFSINKNNNGHKNNENKKENFNAYSFSYSNFIVLLHFLVLTVTSMKCSGLFVLFVYELDTPQIVFVNYINRYVSIG